MLQYYDEIDHRVAAKFPTSEQAQRIRRQDAALQAGQASRAAVSPRQPTGWRIGAQHPQASMPSSAARGAPTNASSGPRTAGSARSSEAGRKAVLGIMSFSAAQNRNISSHSIARSLSDNRHPQHRAQQPGKRRTTASPPGFRDPAEARPHYQMGMKREQGFDIEEFMRDRQVQLVHLEKAKLQAESEKAKLLNSIQTTLQPRNMLH